VDRGAGIALPGYRSFVLGLPTGRRLEQILKDFRPDVVHLASPVFLRAAGGTAARKLGVPSVAVFQTDVAGFARRYGFRGADRAIWAWLRHVHRQADRTLVPSSATLEQLQRRGIERLAMWRRGVDTHRFDPAHRSADLRRTLVGPGETLVGYVGRLAGTSGSACSAPGRSARCAAGRGRRRAGGRPVAGRAAHRAVPRFPDRPRTVHNVRKPGRVRTHRR